MKTIKDFILNFVLLLAIVYLPFAFILNEFYPLKWDIYIRCLYVLTIFVIVYIALQQYNKK